MRKLLLVPLLVVASVILAACNANGTFMFSGNVTFGENQIVTLHKGARAEVVEEATFTRGEVKITFTPGQIIQAKSDVVIDLTNGTILGEFELVAPSEIDNIAPTASVTPTSGASSELNFVLAHGKTFQDYITDQRDYRELTVEEIHAALLVYGYTDSSELVIAHSDEVREWQETAGLPKGTYDQGKAIIKVGEILNLKADKAFMIVSPNVYSRENPGGPNQPLSNFDPTPNE